MKSEEKRFSIDRENFMSFEELCRQAYKQALLIHGIDDCGNARDKRFSRSSSDMRVEFEGFTLIGNMVGGSNVYKFKTWLQSHVD